MQLVNKFTTKKGSDVMKRLAALLFIVAVLGISSRGHAQESASLTPADSESSWNLILKPFLTEGFLKSWKISIDSYVGGIYLYPGQGSSDRNTFGLRQGPLSNTTGSGMKMRPTIFAEAIYRGKQRFGIGISGSAFAARGIDELDRSPTGVPFLRFVEDELSMTSLEVFGWKTARKMSDEKFDLLAGLKIAQFEVRRNESDTMTPYIYDFFKPSSAFYGRMELERVARTRERYIVGPFVGVRMARHFGPVMVTGLLKQSVLFGTKNELTSVVRGGHKENVDINFPCFIGSRESFIGCNANVLVPVTEARIKLSQKVGDRLSFGAGVFASLWFNVPAAPVFPAQGICGSTPCVGEVLPAKTRLFLAGLFIIKW